MRASDYNIYVPLPGSEKYVLIHGYSGAVDVADKELVEFVQRFNGQGSDSHLAADQALIETLQSRGYLTTRTPEQEQTMAAALAHVIHKNLLESKKLTFGVLITYDCNLRCFYCYELWVRSKGREWVEAVMDEPITDAAFKAMEKLGASQGSEIILYGGEPFLKQNREAVERIVHQGWEHGYRFTAVTNGVELEAFLELLGPDKIYNLQVTLDGPPTVHNKRRHKADGSGSFNDIIRSIDAALDTGVLITVRANLDQRNASQYAELACIFMEKGWADQPNFRFYAFPVHGKNASATISRVELGVVLKDQARQSQYSMALSSTCEGTGHEIRHKFRSLLKADDYPSLHSAYCAANSNTYVFDPHGNIYPCTEIVGSDNEKLGQYYPELILDERTIQRWHGRIVTNIPKCRTCKYALLCGGGCTAQAMYKADDTFVPYCEQFGELLEMYVPVAYREHLEEQERVAAARSSEGPDPRNAGSAVPSLHPDLSLARKEVRVKQKQQS